MSDLFREVDEELQQDRLKSFGRRFGPIIAAVVVVVLAGAAILSYLESEEQAARDAAATSYYDATTKEPVIRDKLAELAQDDSAGIYGALARIEEVAAQNDPATLLSAINQENLDPQLRAGMARIYGYHFAHLGWQAVENFVNMLSPSMVGAAAEIEFLAHIADKNMEMASEALTRWQAVERVTPSMASRRNEAATYLKLMS